MDSDSNAQILPEDSERQDDLLHNQKNPSSNSPVKISEMQHSQSTPSKRTHASIMDEVIDADPISYKLPDDFVFITPITKNGPGQSSSRSRKATQSQTPAWLENWAIEARPRSNGRLDKYYYHKMTKVMCRSLKEVERYEKEGILPGRKGKVKAKINNTKQEFKQMGANVEEKQPENISAQKFVVNSQDSENIYAEKLLADHQTPQNMFLENFMEDDARKPEKISAEQFLKDAYHNQLHLFDGK